MHSSVVDACRSGSCSEDLTESMCSATRGWPHNVFRLIISVFCFAIIAQSRSPGPSFHTHTDIAGSTAILTHSFLVVNVSIYWI